METDRRFLALHRVGGMYAGIYNARVCVRTCVGSVRAGVAEELAFRHLER